MKKVLLISLYIISSLSLEAHKSWKFHAQDMYEVLQLKEDPRLTQWMKYISSDLIDGYDAVKAYSIEGKKAKFGEYIRYKYPRLSFPHRYLYHWGFNARPWTKDWEEKVSGWNEEDIKALQSDLIQEQKRRNGQANKITEDLFQLEHTGKEARIANIILSIVYDAHILGDYEPDNKSLKGLQDVSSVVGDIISRVNSLDKKAAQPLTKRLKYVSNNPQLDVQEKALKLSIILKQEFSKFMQTADDGIINGIIQQCGFEFHQHAIREHDMTENDLTVNLSTVEGTKSIENNQTEPHNPQMDSTNSQDSDSLDVEETDNSNGIGWPILLLGVVLVIFIIVIIILRKQ